MVASVTLRQSVITSAYEDLHLMVYQITHKFSIKYHIPFEDLISEAHVIFVKACDSFNAKHGAALSSWVYSKVTWGLSSFLRKELRHRGLANVDDLDESSEEHQRFLLELKSELGRDAQTVVAIFLDSRSDFTRLCKWTKATTRPKILATLKEHLEDLGWAAHQITQAFHEIERALGHIEEAPEPEPPRKTVFERLKTTRDEIWLLARVGLTPSEVKALLS